MKNPFYSRPEKRQFNYKPRFSDTSSKDEEGNFDPDKFGEKIHKSWSKRREKRRDNSATLRVIIWMLFIVFILAYVVYRFML